MIAFNHHSIGDFHGNIMAGMATDDTSMTETTRWHGTSRFSFYSYANALRIAAEVPALGMTKKRLVGVFGEVRLDWKNTVFLSVTGRNDWTSNAFTVRTVLMSTLQ